jgi:hypothetical protein
LHPFTGLTFVTPILVVVMVAAADTPIIDNWSTAESGDNLFSQQKIGAEIPNV